MQLELNIFYILLSAWQEYTSNSEHNVHDFCITIK
jgi:hypothetical protein